MEVTLLKEAKMEEEMAVEEVLEDELVEVLKSKEENDIESALTLLENTSENDNEKEIIIDRHQEDADVTEFQSTGDLELLERVYKNRIPTLKSWASKNYYPGLTSSVEDLFEDLSVVFVKAAEKYDKERGTFNTCLFNFLLNRIKNIHNAKYAKKRISEDYEGPLNGMILSLDYSYSDSDGSSELTLKDIIPGKEDPEESLDFRDIIAFLSKGNPLLKDFFRKICAGNSLASVLKEYKTRKGKIDLSRKKDVLKKLVSRKNNRLATEIVKSSKKVSGDFKMIEYDLVGKNENRLAYVVEMRKTNETDFIVKFIRDLKKHKSYYISKIRGE